MGEPVFGDELRRLREQLGLSLKKFAKLVHYDSGYLSKIENGLKPPTKTLAKVCDEALGAGERLSALVSPRAASTSSRWNLLGYLNRLSGDEAAAHNAWSTGIKHIAACAGRGKRSNLRVQSWLANIEACVGHTERARAAIVRLTEAEPHNGYIKYRLTHVLAELGDAEAAIRMLREAVQDGFLSVPLLLQEERLGLSCLIDLPEYRQVRLVLQQNVDRAKNKYARPPEGAD